MIISKKAGEAQVPGNRRAKACSAGKVSVIRAARNGLPYKAAAVLDLGTDVKKSAAILILFLMLWGGPAVSAQKLSDLTTPTPIPQNDVLVIGFMGGRDAWNNETVGVGRMAKRLREMNLQGVHVETFENLRRELAVEFVEKALDRKQDGKLDGEELASARIIVYGQSFGGAAVVKFARQLQTLGIPVMLTVQVDSVGRACDVVPSNVEVAANLYQDNGMFIHGAHPIRAEDPAKTRILGDYRFDYREKPVDISAVPWYKKLLREDHTRMDHDPDVWNKVEDLILGAIQGK